MTAPMLEWVDHPHAGFVLAAYAVAAAALIGLAALSWCDSRRRSREWQRIQAARQEDRR